MGWAEAASLGALRSLGGEWGQLSPRYHCSLWWYRRLSSAISWAGAGLVVPGLAACLATMSLVATSTATGAAAPFVSL